MAVLFLSVPPHVADFPFRIQFIFGMMVTGSAGSCAMKNRHAGQRNYTFLSGYIYHEFRRLV